MHQPPVVLIVDNHQDSLAMYAFGLLAMGLRAVTADNDQDGFDRACRLQPDVIVVDDALAGGSAPAFIQRLREDPRTRHTTILVLSGNDSGTAKPTHSPGCDRVVLKPCEPDALAFEIQSAMAVRRPAV